MALDDPTDPTPDPASGIDPVLAGLCEPLATFRQGQLDGEVHLRRNFAWVVLRRDREGGLALRFPVLSPDAECRAVEQEDTLVTIECSGALGDARLTVRGEPFGIEQLRATLEFTAKDDLALPDLPRDLVPFDAVGNPTATRSKVEAVQRKLNTGFAYFTLERPQLGKVLYQQNLTALNDYFNATGSKPENAVGGEGHELGYVPPRNPDTGKAVLPAGQRLTLYDTLLVVRGYPEQAEDASAWQFLDMMGSVYGSLEPPTPHFRDWPQRAEATIHDLVNAGSARTEHFGHSYFHPYTAAEYPDVMVQLSLASALDEWGRWSGVRHPLVREIMAGIDGFYDDELQTLRRYLPDVGKDKDADAVDSWYYYHPLMSLANLALGGDEAIAPTARELFFAGIGYGIRSAHHFDYKWPILYKIRDFAVIREVAESDQRGQTDVGGIYAWVMLQAFELSHDRRYLDEAENAIAAARGMRFNLNYQANLTAWGAAACIRLWRITGNKQHLTQSYVYLASFFHNSQIWKSDIGLAQHWSNFLGVTCLEDAPYMAAYECFDSFAAFERYLDLGGPDLIAGVKLLVGEYCRHALGRAWYYYPDALPDEAIATQNRNGFIARQLNFPVEDLYPDGQLAGQVGQEVYGAGAAMVYASRAFHRIAGAPFLLFCDCFVRAIHQLDGRTIHFNVDGALGVVARIALVPIERGAPLPEVSLRSSTGQAFAMEARADRLEAEIAVPTDLLLSWP